MNGRFPIRLPIIQKSIHRPASNVSKELHLSLNLSFKHCDFKIRRLKNLQNFLLLCVFFCMKFRFDGDRKIHPRKKRKEKNRGVTNERKDRTTGTKMTDFAVTLVVQSQRFVTYDDTIFSPLFESIERERKVIKNCSLNLKRRKGSQKKFRHGQKMATKSLRWSARIT